MRSPLSIVGALIACIATLLFSARPQQASAQVDTIRIKDHRLNTATLKPGMRQYLVYFQNARSPKTLRFWLWLRDTKIETRNGEKVFATTQHWYGADTMSYRTGYSVNRVKDFSPVYHTETIAGKVGAYNWDADKIKGADSVALNAKKDFTLNFTEANFNWNLDIETFEMLPLAAGKTFAINFYDAGFGKPEYIIYKVTGSEVVSTLDNQKVDCWILLNEGENKGNKYTQAFWISKKGHEFIKEEDSFGGGYRYKVKMPAGAVNILPRFSVK
ncbi:hypothetical protein EWM62_07600 [Mucilaginibacter terrigena]|uniref:DUF3108 domain-containing protein n=1 Tax=Mucilaginibacter terrigena TaxID=2492395 RepID=A0A4Q5LMS5_9SPHI|nr:hypothetical protein [Mucilaginibacter terrigena]RYU90513.1 hypothetical protein EWM62_07600 [Mucilaginibacter terrigena]